MKDHEHAPQHDDVRKQHELENSEVQDVLQFVKRYGKQIGIGFAAVMAVILAVSGITQHRESNRAEAGKMLMEAKTPQQLEEVIARHGSLPVAQTALLSLAKESFNSGDIAQARAQYERFVKEYKNSESLPVAEFGLASCLEAEGNYDSAATQLDAFVKKYTTSYLRPQAILNIARCKKMTGKLDEARILLEDFLAGNIGTRWANEAESALQQLESK